MLVEMERDLRKVLSTGQGDGGSILRQLLRVPKRVANLSERMARGVLQMPGDRKVSDESNGRHVRKHLIQTGKT